MGRCVSANRQPVAVLLPAQLAMHRHIQRDNGTHKEVAAFMGSFENERLSKTMHFIKRCISINNHQFTSFNKQTTEHQQTTASNVKFSISLVRSKT